jgi:hypothetical protein
MFSEEEIMLVLQDFPKFELCYEMITHKKVHGANIILAIPDGKKYFAWFTSYKNDNVCFLLEINETNNIIDVKMTITSFSDKLALGTIFYGTVFYNKNISYFCVEDMYYYAGKSCNNMNYINKLETLRDIFRNDICQTALTNKFTVFGLPLMSNDLSVILKESQLLSYKIKDLKFRYFNIKKIFSMKYFKPGSHNKDNNIVSNVIFKISADIEPDIYNLFIYNNGVEEYYDNAFIPDYKTSVMMNNLFRKIKENANLDAIEESDDEEEFENGREDKYVYLDRSFKINCEYNKKFKRWVPISLAGKNDRIITINSLKNLLNNSINY